jgi:hypothetical protein
MLYVTGTSRTYYLPIQTISRPPQSRETIPLKRCHLFLILYKFIYYSTGLQHQLSFHWHNSYLTTQQSKYILYIFFISMQNECLNL